MQFMRRIIFQLAIAVLAGCSGIKSYSGAAQENLRVHTVIDSGSMMKNVVAELDISRVDARCQTDYLGRVYLDKPDVRVGLPVDQPLYLGFIFASNGIFSQQSSVMHHILLTPRSGYEYVAQVSYVGGIYDVVLRENRRGSTASQLLGTPSKSGGKSVIRSSVNTECGAASRG